MAENGTSNESASKRLVTIVSTGIAIASGVLTLYTTLKGDRSAIAFLVLLVSIAALVASIAILSVRRSRPHLLDSYPPWIVKAAATYAAASVMICVFALGARLFLFERVATAAARYYERPSVAAAWADLEEAKTLLAASGEDPAHPGIFDAGAIRKIAGALQRIASFQTSWDADAARLRQRLNADLPRFFAFDVHDVFDERRDHVRLYRFISVGPTYTSPCDMGNVCCPLGLRTCRAFYFEDPTATAREPDDSINEAHALYLAIPISPGRLRVIVEPTDDASFQLAFLLRWNDGIAVSYLGSHHLSFGGNDDSDWWALTRIGRDERVVRSRPSYAEDDLLPDAAKYSFITAVSSTAVDGTTSSYLTNSRFDECHACPHLYQTYHAQWVPEEGRFAVTRAGVRDTPYAAVMRFINVSGGDDRRYIRAAKADVREIENLRTLPSGRACMATSERVQGTKGLVRFRCDLHHEPWTVNVALLHANDGWKLVRAFRTQASPDDF